LNTTKTAPQAAAGRVFVRSFNIMLKLTRLYGFDHARTAEQVEKTWTELQAVLSGESDGDILLAASANQLLLNGALLGNSGADRNLAQLMTSIGLSSIHFSSNVTREDFDKFVRSFPSGGSAAALLAEKYKNTMAGVSGIQLNEICYVPADSSSVNLDLAAQITERVLDSAGVEEAPLPATLSETAVKSRSACGPNGRATFFPCPRFGSRRFRSSAETLSASGAIASGGRRDHELAGESYSRGEFLESRWR